MAENNDVMKVKRFFIFKNAALMSESSSAAVKELKHA